MKVFVRAQDFGKKDPVSLAKEIKAVGFDGLQLAINKAGFRQLSILIMNHN